MIAHNPQRPTHNALGSFAIWLSKQRALPYKTRRSVIKRFYPDMLKNYAFETDFFCSTSGLRFAGNIVNYIDRVVYFCGAHEKFMLTLLRDYITRLKAKTNAPVGFMDVGANAGNHSLFMATLVNNVHSFEPFERVRKQMEHNLALNRIHNVTIHPVGLGNENKIMPFYVAPDTNLGASSFAASHKQDNNYAGELQIRRGDDVAQESSISNIAAIKIDVEGYEKYVLEGLQNLLTRDRPLLIVELSPTTRETLGSGEAFFALFPANYSFYYFASASYNSGKYKLAPFDYKLTPKLQDVIACPNEHLDCLQKA